MDFTRFLTVKQKIKNRHKYFLFLKFSETFASSWQRYSPFYRKNVILLSAHECKKKFKSLHFDVHKKATITSKHYGTSLHYLRIICVYFWVQQMPGTTFIRFTSDDGFLIFNVHNAWF